MLWGLLAIGTGVLWLAGLFWLAQRLPPLQAYAVALVPLLLLVGVAFKFRAVRDDRWRKRLRDQEFLD